MRCAGLTRGPLARSVSEWQEVAKTAVKAALILVRAVMEMRSSNVFLTNAIFRSCWTSCASRAIAPGSSNTVRSAEWGEKLPRTHALTRLAGRL